MTIIEIADYCTRTVGDISSEAVDYAKKAIRLQYATLYDAHSWREAQRTLDVTVDPVLNGVIFLPYDAEEVIFCELSRDTFSYARLTYRERDWIERFSGPTFSLPGNMPWFYRGENLAWPYLNPGKFTFTTSDQSPFNIYIEGKNLAGYPVNESFIINASPNPSVPGTTIPASVTTFNSFSIVTSLSKTGGSLTIQAEAPAAQIVLPKETSSLVFTQIILYPPPIFTDQSGNPFPVYARIQVKLKPDTLDNDMSVPRISHIWSALIEYTLSSLYTRARQLSKADMREQKAIGHVKAAVNVEKNQSEFRQQVVPAVYETGDYLGRGEYVTSGYPFG